MDDTQGAPRWRRASNHAKREAIAGRCWLYRNKTWVGRRMQQVSGGSQSIAMILDMSHSQESAYANCCGRLEGGVEQTPRGHCTVVSKGADIDFEEFAYCLENSFGHPPMLFSIKENLTWLNGPTGWMRRGGDRGCCCLLCGWFIDKASPCRRDRGSHA